MSNKLATTIALVLVAVIIVMWMSTGPEQPDTTSLSPRSIQANRDGNNAGGDDSAVLVVTLPGAATNNDQQQQQQQQQQQPTWPTRKPRRNLPRPTETEEPPPPPPTAPPYGSSGRDPITDHTPILPLLVQRSQQQQQGGAATTAKVSSQQQDEQQQQNIGGDDHRMFSVISGGVEHDVNDWVVVSRSEAVRWWRYRFGHYWSCGVGQEAPDPEKQLGEFDDELTQLITTAKRQEYLESLKRKQQQQKQQKQQRDQQQQQQDSSAAFGSRSSIAVRKQRNNTASPPPTTSTSTTTTTISPQEVAEIKRQNQDARDTKASWPIRTMSWNSQTMFMAKCAPRFVSASAAAATQANTLRHIGIKSVTMPSLGMGCFRGLMVLDRSAPSLERAMSRRCFRQEPRKLRRKGGQGAKHIDRGKSKSEDEQQEQENQQQPSKRKKDVENDPDNDLLLQHLADPDEVEEDGATTTTTTTTTTKPRLPFVVGLGHSHTRYLSAMLCMAANLSWCADFTSIQRLPFYPSDPAKVVGTNSAGGEDAAAQANEGDQETTKPTNLFIPRPPLRLVYTSSYYDQRHTLVRFLRWLVSGGSRTNSNGNANTVAALMKKNVPPLQQAFIPSLGVMNKTEIARSDRMDESIVKWARQVILPLLQLNNKNNNNKQGQKNNNNNLFPTHFVLSRGEWDMLYLNPDPWAMALQMRRFLNVVGRIFPDALLILQLPQVHVPIPVNPRAKSAREKKSNARAEWRNTCSSTARIELLRHVNVCAAHLAVKQQQQQQARKDSDNHDDGTSSVTASLSDRLILFDSDRLTRSYFGVNFVDGTGHHYIDSALEVLALEMRRIVERADVAQEYISKTQDFLLSSSSSEGENSCAIVKKASSSSSSSSSGAGGDVGAQSSSLLRRCSCHRDVPQDPQFCRSTKILARDIG